MGHPSGVLCRWSGSAGREARGLIVDELEGGSAGAAAAARGLVGPAVVSNGNETFVCGGVGKLATRNHIMS